jgi:hypothetical protein
MTGAPIAHNPIFIDSHWRPVACGPWVDRTSVVLVPSSDDEAAAVKPFFNVSVIGIGVSRIPSTDSSAVGVL